MDRRLTHHHLHDLPDLACRAWLLKETPSHRAGTLLNRDGQEQKRGMNAMGDKMTLDNPSASVGRTNYVALSRAK
jgi:hypothetical protein